MAHARKPKRQKRIEREKQGVTNDKRVKQDDDSSDEVDGKPSKPKSSEQKTLKENQRTTVMINGEKIHVQTKIPRLAKDCNRPSVFFRIDSENFLEEFTKCFQEHIEGFSGLRGSKRTRNEKEKEMEWRKRVEKLPETKPYAQIRKNGQTVSEKDRLLAIERYRELRSLKKSE